MSVPLYKRFGNKHGSHSHFHHTATLILHQNRTYEVNITLFDPQFINVKKIFDREWEYSGRWSKIDDIIVLSSANVTIGREDVTNGRMVKVIEKIPDTEYDLWNYKGKDHLALRGTNHGHHYIVKDWYEEY